MCFAAYTATSITVRDGKIDLRRLNEPGQRNLLARALFTLDSDERMRAAGAGVRGGDAGLDESLRAIRAMLLSMAERRLRVAGQPDVSIGDARATVSGMLADIEARRQRVARYPAEGI